MNKKTVYRLTDDEYKCFKDAVMRIQCPDLTDHHCSVCPMNININYCYPKDAEYRCLLGMMETKLSTIKIQERR